MHDLSLGSESMRHQRAGQVHSVTVFFLLDILKVTWLPGVIQFEPAAVERA